MDKRFISINIKNTNDERFAVFKPKAEAEEFKRKFLEAANNGEEYFVFDNDGCPNVIKINEVVLIQTIPH